MLIAVIVLLTWHLGWPPVYEFPPTQPFQGDQWYNPYASSNGEWLRSNFHAHSKAWGGITYGTNAPEEIWDHYRNLGYDIHSISNYQLIDRTGEGQDLYIPGYEHGIGISQQHHTVIGAESVSWFDFPLYQGLRQKQHIIDLLAPSSEVLFINHPDRHRAYSLEDMRHLTGYTGMEIKSHFADAVDYWDAALSAGRPVWGVCADDSHRLNRASHVANGWLMILSPQRAQAPVLDALRQGAFYSVWKGKEGQPNSLRACEIEEGDLSATFEEPADVIRFVGQGGSIMAWTVGQATASYTLRESDTYVRVEADSNGTTLYLNPVFRHGGQPLVTPPARAAMLATWVIRGGAATLLLLVGYFGVRRRRHTASADAAVRNRNRLPKPGDSGRAHIPLTAR